MHLDLELHLEKLRGFVIVAELGSIHRAARRLKISQPALTRSMKVLEAAVQMRLFSRSNQGIVLTPAGKILEKFCQKLRLDLEDLSTRLQNPKTDLAGRLTVATYESLGVYFWPSFLRNFHKRHPSIHINLVTHDERENWSLLQSEMIHLIVDAEPMSSAQIESAILYRDRFDLFASKTMQERFQLKSEIAPEACRGIPFIYVTKAVDKDGLTIKQHLENYGIEHPLQFSLDSFVTVEAFALEGQGIAVLPKRLAARELERKQILPLRVRGMPKNGFGEHRFCASYLLKNREDVRIKALVQELKTHFQKSEH